MPRKGHWPGTVRLCPLVGVAGAGLGSVLLFFCAKVSMMNKKDRSNPVVQAYEILWRLADEFDELIEEKLRELEPLLPKDYHYPSHLIDADGLLQRRAARKN